MTTISFDAAKPRFADVNHYHPVRDFGLYASSTGAHALGFKVCQGTWVDPTASAHLAGAEAHQLIAIGFAYGTDAVDNFLRLFPPKPGRIPVLDFEGDVTLSSASAWIEAVYAAYGRYPWFYGREAWLRCGQPRDTLIAQCPYWGAQYGSALDVPDGVGTPVAFQFSDGVHGPLPHEFAGIGACDIDMLICSVEELEALAGLPGAVAAAG